METYKIIKNRRSELNLTLKEVATALGVAESTVSRYESSDIQNMGIDKIEALSKVLRCSPSYLMGWDSYDTDALSLTPDESLIIRTYRSADEIDQKAVRRILGLESRADGFYERVSADLQKNNPEVFDESQSDAG